MLTCGELPSCVCMVVQRKFETAKIGKCEELCETAGPKKNDSVAVFNTCTVVSL